MMLGIKHKENKILPKLVVIAGPTSSGKTSLGVHLASLFNGEIVSADSRQVYRGLDIGSGKDLAEYNNTPYHLIDVASPQDEIFNLARYQELARLAIDDILARGKLPIIVGGSGLYLQAVIDNYRLSGISVSDNRKDLEKLGAQEIFAKLSVIKPEFAERLNNSERNNARHLSRYLEIFSTDRGAKLEKMKSQYDSLVIAILRDEKYLSQAIISRLSDRIGQGLIEEVESLNNSGVSWQRLISFGLEYRFVSYYLLGRMGREDMEKKLGIAIRQFAKRQMTWLKRWEAQGRKILWISSYFEAEKAVKNFLKK